MAQVEFLDVRQDDYQGSDEEVGAEQDDEEAEDYGEEEHGDEGKDEAKVNKTGMWHFTLWQTQIKRLNTMV